MGTINRRHMLKVLFLGAMTFGIGISAMGQSMITLDTQKRFQRMEHFGASDCWTAQRLGLFPDEKRERVARWLFSMDTSADGQPQGIGLSLWRFNIGAGSTEQGEASGITDPLRRTECFLKGDGTYDWSKQAGQRWFLRAAARHGVGQFLGFCNSPPVAYTANGLANNSVDPKSKRYNLQEDRYGAYADFLATVLSNLGTREGIRFTEVSPFNEPEWSWEKSNQEGSPARVEDIARLVRLLDIALTARRLDTRISLTESGKITYMYKSHTDLPGQDNQIEELFDPSSPNTLVGLSHVPSRISGHSYWSTTPNDVLYGTRRDLREKLDARGLGYWQSEVCIMGNDREIGGGGGKDLTMKTALYVARVIHADLSVAQASAWHWWLAMTFANYKDGLIYVKPNADKTDGDLGDSRLMWTLGNFSRFIRPGAVRIGVLGQEADIDDPQGLMISAYLNENERTLTCVMVHMGDNPRPVRLSVPSIKIREGQVYLTSDAPGATLKPQTGADPLAGFEVPARSVVTWVGRY